MTLPAVKDLFDLSGKVAIVTGASRGIGEEIARLLAAAGAEVVISSRKQEGCEAVAAAINADGGKAVAKACHIGELEQISALESFVKERFGRADILVNNAAANPYFGTIFDTTPEAFEKIADVNIRGYFFMTLAGARLMGEGGGAVLNIASVNGVTPAMLQGSYSMSKAAVISMTKAFALEGALRNIRVNAILPGLTDTKFASVITGTQALLERALARVPMGRIAQPSEIAGAALYLCSPAASYTTGAILEVDGGYLIG